MDRYLTHILEFQKQLSRKEIQLFNAPVSLSRLRPDIIVIVGMGGSGLPADLLLNLQDSLGLKVPVIAWKNYGLPPLHSKKRPLFVFISFSGNTKETLSGLKRLLKRGARRAAAAVTSSGELEQISRQEKLPLATFPAGDLTPREALGYTYFCLKLLLKRFFPNLNLADFANLKPSRFEFLGKSLAREIKGRIPLIFTGFENSHLGYVWKVNFNETSKIPAFTNTIPESAHNEIAEFEKGGKKFIPLFLTSKKTNETVKRKINNLKKVLSRHGVPTKSVVIPGTSEEEITWNGVILSHFVAYYLAKIKKTDPQKNCLIDQLKKLEK